jgi:hypothetical protein
MIMGLDGGTMPVPVEQLCQRWGHSFEEDREGIVVYRSFDFDFPRARGRDGIEFRPDGSFIDWGIGRGDASEARPGTWRPADHDRVEVTTASGDKRVMEIVRISPDRLELRTVSAP